MALNFFSKQLTSVQYQLDFPNRSFSSENLSQIGSQIRQFYNIMANIIKLISYRYIFLLIKQIMGNEPTKNEIQNTIQTNTLNHPTLKNAKVKSSGLVQQLQLTIAVPNKDIYDHWQDRVKMYVQPNLQNQVIFLPKSLQYDDGGICGTTGVVKAIYHYPPLLLSEELENRIVIMQPFSQQQIWYLLYVLAYAASTNHNKNLILGDIRPRNIFLSPQGDISIGCLASFADEAPNYQKTLRFKQKTFLAPEQVIQLQANMIEDHTPTISENFSIGMTLMSLMLLHDEQTLYFSQFSVFDTEKFKKETSYLAHCELYPDLLRSIVLGLLQPPSHSRITSQQIFRLLTPYQQKIINLTPFKVDGNHISSQGLLSQKLNKVKIDNYQQQPSKIISYSQRKSWQAKSQKSSNIHNQYANSYQTPNKNIARQYRPQFIVHNGLNSNSNFSPNVLNSSLNLVGKLPQKQVTEKTFLPTSSSHKRFYNNQFQTQDNSDYRRENKVSKSVDIRSSSGQAPPTYNKIIVRQEPVGNSNHFNVRFEDSQVISIPYRPPPLENDHINSGIVQSKVSFSKNQNQICFLNASPMGESMHQQKSSESNDQIHQKYRHLQDIGRETKSINNPSEFRLKQPQTVREMLRDIDDQVLRSQKMFPSHI